MKFINFAVEKIRIRYKIVVSAVEDVDICVALLLRLLDIAGWQRQRRIAFT